MTGIWARQSDEARAEGEALIRKADRLRGDRCPEQNAANAFSGNDRSAARHRLPLHLTGHIGSHFHAPAASGCLSRTTMSLN
jgi:hypothetical protein